MTCRRQGPGRPSTPRLSTRTGPSPQGVRTTTCRSGHTKEAPRRGQASRAVLGQSARCTSPLPALDLSSSPSMGPGAKGHEVQAERRTREGGDLRPPRSLTCLRRSHECPYARPRISMTTTTMTRINKTVPTPMYMVAPSSFATGSSPPGRPGNLEEMDNSKHARTRTSSPEGGIGMFAGCRRDEIGSEAPGLRWLEELHRLLPWTGTRQR